MYLRVAETIGQQFIDLLSLTCEEMIIGGSIRRGNPEVKDIEIICRPIIYQNRDSSKLGDHFIEHNLLDERLHILIEKTNVPITRDRPRKNNAKPPFGPRTYLIKYDGAPVDIFSIFPPADWFTQVVIRTGSKEFNKWLVTTCRERAKVRFTEGHIVELSAPDLPGVEKPVYPASERDVFTLCGIEYIPPEHRGINFMDFVKEL